MYADEIETQTGRRGPRRIITSSTDSFCRPATSNVEQASQLASEVWDMATIGEGSFQPIRELALPLPPSKKALSHAIHHFPIHWLVISLCLIRMLSTFARLLWVRSSLNARWLCGFITPVCPGAGLLEPRRRIGSLAMARYLSRAEVKVSWGSKLPVTRQVSFWVS